MPCLAGHTLVINLDVVVTSVAAGSFLDHLPCLAVVDKLAAVVDTLVAVKDSFLDRLPCLAVVDTLAVVRDSFLDHQPYLAVVDTLAGVCSLAVVRGSCLDLLAFAHLPFEL